MVKNIKYFIVENMTQLKLACITQKSMNLVMNDQEKIIRSLI